MDSTERISQLSHRIFNTTLTEKRVGRSSNPFATPAFTGTLIPADIFTKSQVEQATKMGLGDKISQGTKRIAATFVAGINNFSDRFYAGFEAIRNVGAKVKESVVSAWNKVQEFGAIEISFSSIGEKMMSAINSRSRERELKVYRDKPVGELSDLLIHHLAKLEEAAKSGEGISLVA